MLKELIADKKQPPQRRFRAAETLLEVYRRHDVNEERKEARRKGHQTVPAEPEPSGEPPEQQQTPEDAQRAAREFLERSKGGSDDNVEQ